MLRTARGLGVENLGLEPTIEPAPQRRQPNPTRAAFASTSCPVASAPLSRAHSWAPKEMVNSRKHRGHAGSCLASPLTSGFLSRDRPVGQPKAFLRPGPRSPLALALTPNVNQPGTQCPSLAENLTQLPTLFLSLRVAPTPEHRPVTALHASSGVRELPSERTHVQAGLSH